MSIALKPSCDCTNGSARSVVAKRAGVGSSQFEPKGLGAPFEVSPTELYRTATVKARRYLLTDLIDRGDHERAVDVRPQALLPDGR